MSAEGAGGVGGGGARLTPPQFQNVEPLMVSSHYGALNVSSPVDGRCGGGGPPTPAQGADAAPPMPTPSSPFPAAMAAADAAAAPGAALAAAAGSPPRPGQSVRSISPGSVSSSVHARSGAALPVHYTGGPIRVGICCMAKKATSAPMQEFLRRMVARGFDICVFAEEDILNLPPEEWPVVECCIPFFSRGFPLDKACSYAAMHPDCFCLTEPSEQRVLLDRRAVYHALDRNNIPTSRHVFCSRDGWRDDPPPEIVEEEEYIIVDGERLDKPFVEKPVDSEDHNIRIYYSREMGGGSRHLFRKVGDKSSEFHPTVNKIRREGSYVYEEFVDTTKDEDVKVYTVGSDYCHAECRKSPVVDGKVFRDAKGKEIRQTTALDERERQIARKIVKVFRQRVCGFDLLRAEGRAGGARGGARRSFVCDVNGWSFVKGRPDYYDRATEIISEIFDEEMRRRGLSRKYRDVSSGKRSLRGVVALFRHGDRTPKQKLKFKTNCADVLRLAFGAAPAPAGAREVVVKGACGAAPGAGAAPAPAEGGAALGAWGALLAGIGGGPPRADVGDAERALMRGMAQVIAREAEGTKLQVKPLPGGGVVARAQVILKWGGWLTEAGCKQARQLGRLFSRRVFRGAESSTDLLVFANHERRVRRTACEFAVALRREQAALSGMPVADWSEELINPGARGDRICRALDDTDPAKGHIEQCRGFVRRVMHADTDEECAQWAHLPGFREIVRLKQTPRRAMRHLHSLMLELIRHIPTGRPLHRGESAELVRARWTSLAAAFRDGDEFDTSKVSDVCDYATYDVSYNQTALAPLDMYPLFELASVLHSFVVVAEYGTQPQHRARIGALIAAPLLSEWMEDLEELQFCDSPQVRVYFSSESHVHAMYNALYNAAPDLSQRFLVVSDPIPLHYLAHIVIKVYRYDDMRDGAVGRYQYEVFFSGGIDTNAFGIVQDHHVTQLSPMIRIHNNLFYTEFRCIAERAAQLAAESDTATAGSMPFP